MKFSHTPHVSVMDCGKGTEDRVSTFRDTKAVSTRAARVTVVCTCHVNQCTCQYVFDTWAHEPSICPTCQVKCLKQRVGYRRGLNTQVDLYGTMHHVPRLHERELVARVARKLNERNRLLKQGWKDKLL